MIQHIKRLLGIGKPDPTRGNSIIVNVEKLERRVALLENGVLEEYTVEREGDQNIVGGIFKGRVKNIEGGLKAMFVDIGLDKNAFLHFWDAIPAALDGGLEEIQREGKKKQQKKISSKDIPDIYPIGSEIVIQVSKGPIGTKGPRVTTNISLAGRYLVLMPYTEQFGISRKIEDPKERLRLRKIVQKLAVPEGMGIIMRTIAQGTRARHFVRDLHMLLEQWDEIEARRANNPAPACIFQEPGLIERTARDFLTDEIDQVICDDAATTEMIRNVAGKISRRAKRRIHYMPSAAGQPIFERINIQKQIDEAFSRQVWLKCGGYIVIDETEALIAIDVNTGRNRGSKDVDKMILETNVEAAVEVARQLRLRNIGGLVQGHQGASQARQGQDPSAPDFPGWPDGNDPPAPQRIAAGLHVRTLPVLPGPRAGEDADDHVRGNPAPLEHRHPETPRLDRRHHRRREHRRAQPLQKRGRQAVGRTRTLALRAPYLPLRPHAQPRAFRHHRCRH
jgi:ribonuclease G